MGAPRRWKTVVKAVVMSLGALFVVAQFVPYGRAQSNPPVVKEPAWNHPDTRALAARACFDCHSNETRWPWYASVAPASWLLYRHVEEGRAALNFSMWQRPSKDAHEAAGQVRSREMPLRGYALAHPGARLTKDERRALAEGLAATLGTAARGED